MTKSRGVEFCYVDHSKSPDHNYYVDHMNAHLRTERCEKAEKRARQREKNRAALAARSGESK